MANELNEQQYAAPEQEMRVAAPVEIARAEPANTVVAPEEIAQKEPSNDGTDPSPVIRLVDNKNFKTFSYGEDDSKFSPQKNSDRHQNQAVEAINAIRNDISLIAVGSSQIQANQNLVSRQTGNYDAHTSVRGQQELYRQLAEQRRLEVWNNAQINFGGVMMTNGQALAAIRGINKDADKWADRAVARGDINEEDREKFKEKLRRLEELQKLEQEKAAKGETLSAANSKEKSDILNSPEVYRTIKESTQDKDFANNARLQSELSRTGTSASYSASDDSGITAPSIKQDFIAASTAQPPATQAPKQQVAEQVQKNNLSVPGLA